MTSPIVSICCVTYNHAPFIRQALDGFLMQEPPTGVSKDEPWYEILIHDDCSTDGTTEIIKEYAAKYPDKIFPLYEEENQYSKGAKVDLFNFTRAKGKYRAYCEGDDYWTEPKKLQMQVDFMESHPEYSVCFHAYKAYNAKTKQLYLEPNKSPSQIQNGGADVTSDMYLKKEFGAQPLTMLYRASAYDLKWFDNYEGFRDTHEIYLLLRQGKGYFLDFIGGVYVKHEGSLTTSISILTSCKEERLHNLDLYLHNREDRVLRDYLIGILLWNYDVYRRSKNLSEFWQVLKDIFQVAPGVAFRVWITIMKRGIKSRL